MCDNNICLIMEHMGWIFHSNC